jgi:hypothetical protein
LTSIGKRKIDGSTFKKNSAYGNAKKYTHEEVTMFKTFVEEDEKNDIESDAFEFVKFESALENNVKKVNQYFKDMCAIRDECPICITVKMLIPLHGDVRHRICKVCRDSTVGDKCPICRADLTE